MSGTLGFMIGYSIVCLVAFICAVLYALWDYKYGKPDPKLGHLLFDKHLYWPLVFLICTPVVNGIVAIVWTVAVARRYVIDWRTE